MRLRKLQVFSTLAKQGGSPDDNADQMQRSQDALLREDLGNNNRMMKVLAPNTVSPVPLRLSGQEPQTLSGGAMYSFLVGRTDYLDEIDPIFMVREGA